MTRNLTFYAILFALAMMALAFAVPAYAADPNLKIQAIEPVVKINQSCSGTIISSDMDATGKVKTQILTAKHCIKGDGGQLNIEITERGKPIKDVNVWYDNDRSDYKADLAVVTLRDTETVYPTVTIASEELVETGDDVWVVGYPMGLSKTITEGMFTGYEMLGKEHYVRATPSATGGNSGGGLFQKNGDNYEQIGVTSRGYPAAPFMTYHVPLKEIQEFLRLKPSKVTVTLSTPLKLPTTPPIGE